MASVRTRVRLIILAAVAPAIAHAAEPPSSSAASNLYRLVKRFDFDERRAGNFEHTPMYWSALTGPGLPHYNTGRFDESVGDAAPPSFRLRIAGAGSVCYEYLSRDVAAIPGSDYVITARMRTEGLIHSRAFLAACFVDRFDVEIPGSQRVSAALGSEEAPPDRWTTVQLDLPGDFPQAYALRLQLWVLQRHVWQERDPELPDPMPAHDVLASAWFDDLCIYRLPRSRLRFTNPAQVVEPGRTEAIVVDVFNATPFPMGAELAIFDERGVAVHVLRTELPADAARLRLDQDAPDDPRPSLLGGPGEEESGVAVPLPDLPPGRYEARFRLLLDRETMQERTLRFAILGAMPEASRRADDIGVDLEGWRDRSRAAARLALRALGCGAVRVPVPMDPALIEQGHEPPLRRLAELLRDFQEDRLDVTGVLAPPDPAGDRAPFGSTRAWIAQDDAWDKRAGPVMARLAGLVSAWQIDADAADGGRALVWTDAEVQRLRERLVRFVPLTRLAAPGDLLEPAATQRDAVSLRIPDAIPSRRVSDQLESLGQLGSGPRWLTLSPQPSSRLTQTERMRRVVLAKAAQADRCFVAAPLARGEGGGFEPTEDFVPLRTLMHMIGGRRATSSLDLAEDVAAIVFEGRGSACILTWTWRAEPYAPPIELYLGEGAAALDLWGRDVPLEVVGGRVRLAPTPMPIVIHNVDAALVRLAAGVAVSPTLIQAHDSATRPTLTFRNHFGEPLTGELAVQAPEGWTVRPAEQRFSLAPQQEFAQPLELQLGPRQVASQRVLTVRVALRHPRREVIEFAVPITVGLTDVGVEASAVWEGETLVVEHALTNRSEAAVSFQSFCEAEHRPQAEGAFLDVPPGERRVQHYVFPEAGALAGGTLFLGIREIGGERQLDQLVEVPRERHNHRRL